MDTHVKVLAVLFIVLNALGVCFAILLLLSFGGAAGIVGMSANPGDAAIAIPIIGIVGITGAVLILAATLPGVIAGWGLLSYKPWARILGIVVSILHLFNIPFGTALGIYALWVLLNKDTERLFNAAPTPAS